MMPTTYSLGVTHREGATKQAPMLRACSSQPVLSEAFAGMDVPHCRHRHTLLGLGCDCSTGSEPDSCVAPAGAADSACCSPVVSAAAAPFSSADGPGCGKRPPFAASAAGAPEPSVVGSWVCSLVGSWPTADWTTMPSHRLAGQTIPCASDQPQGRSWCTAESALMQNQKSDC